MLTESLGPHPSRADKVLQKLQLYLQKNRVCQHDIERLKDSYYVGLSSLWLYATWLEMQSISIFFPPPPQILQQLPPNQQSRLPRNNLVWLRLIIRDIIGWDGEKQVGPLWRYYIAKFRDHIISLHGYYEHLHPDNDRRVKFTYTTSLLTKEYAIASLLTLEQLGKLLTRLSSFLHMKATLIVSPNYATAIFKNRDTYNYFNNGEYRFFKNIEELAAAIFKDHGFNVSMPSPFGFYISSFNEVFKEEYPSSYEILASINPSIEAIPNYANGTSSLMMAARVGDIESALYFLNKKANLHATDSEGRTPLMFAAQYGRTDLVGLFIDKHANINSSAPDDSTALELAARNGYTNIVGLILSRMVSVETSTKLCEVAKAFKSAAAAGQLNTLKYLLSLMDPNAINRHSIAALQVAAQNGYAEIVHEILAVAQLDERDLQRVLMLAAQNGHTKVVAELLPILADIQDNSIGVDNLKQYASFLVAARYDEIEDVYFSLPKVEQANQEHTQLRQLVVSTALLLAAQNGHADLVEIMLEELDDKENLLQDLLDVDFRDAEGNTALMLALQRNDVRVVNSLLPYSDVNLANSSGMTPLMLAAKNGYSEMVEQLLAEEIDINYFMPVGDGKTAFMLAAEHGHVAVVDRLLKEGIEDINEQDSFNRTALMLAINNGHTQVVARLLKEEDIDISLGDDFSDTALTIAASEGYPEIVDMLLAKLNARLVNQDNDASKVALINKINSCDETALMIAAKQGYVEIVAKLLEVEGIKVEVVGECDTISALRLAAQHGHHQVIQQLVASGKIDKNLLNQTDNQGYSALMLAAINNHPDSVKVLLAALVQFSLTTKISEANLALYTQFILDAHHGRINEIEQQLTALTKEDTSFASLVLNSTIILAIKGKHTNVVARILASANIASNLANGDKSMELMIAAFWSDDKRVAELLTSDEIDFKSTNNLLGMALMLAAARGHDQMVAKFLASNKVDSYVIRSVNADNDNALMLAAANGHTKVVAKFLASNKVDVFFIAINKDQNTALMLALSKGQIEVAKMLLASNKLCSINISNNDGNSAVLLAAWGGYSDIVDELLARSEVNVGLVNDNGDTALTLAAQRGHHQVVKKLVASGRIEKSLLNKTNKQGYSALMLAAMHNHRNTVKVLLAALVPPSLTANISEADLDLYTQFILDACQGHADQIAQQLSTLCPVNSFVVDIVVSTARKLAIYNCHPETVAKIPDYEGFLRAAASGDINKTVELFSTLGKERSDLTRLTINTARQLAIKCQHNGIASLLDNIAPVSSAVVASAGQEHKRKRSPVSSALAMLLENQVGVAGTSNTRVNVPEPSSSVTLSQEARSDPMATTEPSSKRMKHE